LSVAILAVSCGYVGDPLPPALNIPNPVQDLRVQQVESELAVNFTIPPKTTENLPITDLGAVELRVGPVPDAGWNQDAWAAAARPVAVDATAPGPVETTVNVREFAGRTVVVAVRLANRKGRSSGWSNPVTLLVEQPVVTPAAFQADSAPNGAMLTWEGYQGLVVVYRDGEQAGEGREGRFLDSRAVLGQKYKYEIQARGDKALGRRSAAVEVTIADRFPPAPPAGLSAVAGAGTVELSWNPNPETDILGYAVRRASGDGPLVTVAEFLDAPAFTDRDIQRGVRYRYAVIAIDLRKNQSPQSQEVEITVP
jgi:hypothetical protein